MFLSSVMLPLCTLILPNMVSTFRLLFSFLIVQKYTYLSLIQVQSILVLKCSFALYWFMPFSVPWKCRGVKDKELRVVLDTIIPELMFLLCSTAKHHRLIENSCGCMCPLHLSLYGWWGFACLRVSLRLSKALVFFFSPFQFLTFSRSERIAVKVTLECVLVGFCCASRQAKNGCHLECSWLMYPHMWSL